MASEVPTAGAQRDLRRRVAELERELEEAHQREAATADLLQVINRPQFALQSVFDAIAESAGRLCDAEFAFVHRFDGELLSAAASYGVTPEGVAAWRKGLPRPAGEDTAIGRAILRRTVVQIPDVQADPAYDVPALAQVVTYRSAMAVPFLRDGHPIGGIAVGRPYTGAFTEGQIRLLRSFADQAVIAIENTRLLNDLHESLQQQTATADVLKVISRSAFDLPGVLDTLVQSSARLCEAGSVGIMRPQGPNYHFAASHGFSSAFVDHISKVTVTAGRGSLAGRVLSEGRAIHVHDILADPEYELREAQRIAGYRTMLGVPLLREGTPIGVIVLTRNSVRPFTDKEIALVGSFADQAVIAIENTRLFEEVEARNRELRMALEQQTATSEILGVISRSPTNVQPIFDAIAESSVRLCDANISSIIRLVGDVRHRVAQHGMPPPFIEESNRIFPQSLTRGLIGDVAILDRKIVHVEDLQNDARYAASQALARTLGYRAALSVPMLRDSGPVGAISVFRQQARRFTETEIGLLRTFADQAVIAIENSRHFEEVQARNRDLTALGEVGRAVSSTLDLKVVLKTIVERAVELSGTDGGSIFYYREQVGRFELGETTGLDEEIVAKFRRLDIATGQTGLGEAIARRRPLQVPDIQNRPSNPLRDAAIEAGLRAGLIVPLFGSEGPLGALVLQRRRPGEFAPAVVSLMQSFADQSAIALENARLFEEIAKKSRELEIASQHKSQFVANMSHELRTPLAAMLGYAELMQEGFYEPQGPKSLDALTRIRSNGKHLLGLINTVLDIAKIESGQFTLNMAEYDIESVVETVRSATESLAQNKKLTLKTEVAKPLPIGLGDEQRLTQVLLNLVGNAIKFTDAGEVRITAGAANGHFALSVSDTGPGIPAEECERIFEKFRQVDSSNTRAKGGTGLGLAIAKEIVEMHGGRIWVESLIGQGSTFHMELPIRTAAAGAA